MPTYAFRCAACGEFDAAFPMASVPAQLDCQACGGAARRIFSAPHLGVGPSTAMKLLDATKRTASEPAVTESLPGRQTSPRPVSRNPLHAKLPRP
ncbi:zinc ribbon domain-containing protein [Streptomyces sp. NPDC048415]|uniref:FmdB family zinc ribbon protein n=1 Tax=Streptomyces sp. NPDC048415 TaxID=3154822 RepID=UPI00342E8E1D